MDAAISAVRRHGAGVSMDQIAEEAQTSKTIIYKYFNDKLGLQTAIAGRYVQELLENAPKIELADTLCVEVVRPLVSSFFALIEREPELYFFVNLTQFTSYGGAGRYLNFDDLAEDLVLTSLQLAHPKAELTDLGKVAARTWADGVRVVVVAVAERWLRAKVTSEMDVDLRDSNFDSAEASMARLPRERLVDYLIGHIDGSLHRMVETEWPGAEMQIAINLED